MHWLMLILSLPTRHASGRVRLWRALKQTGAAALRDGVYLLPAQAATRSFFEAQAAEITATGGQALVLTLHTETPEQEQQFRKLFDRSADYAALKANIDTLRRKLTRPSRTLARDAAQLRKAFAALEVIDFFPGAAHEQVRAALDELTHDIETCLNPHEPRAAPGRVKRLNRAEYQGRTWATRQHLWVDRMASAWLIARFIDPQAKFKWLAKPEACPKKALGFDFDGAAFTHIGNRVTFEVLLASFGLDEDAALSRIGGIVHFLDVGGVPVAEAAGVEAVLKGLRERAKNDDALLAAVTPVFDGLYGSFKSEKP